MASEFEDYCDTWPENSTNKEEDESLTSVSFCLVFHVSFIYLHVDDDDEVMQINNLMESAVETQEFMVTKDQLIDNAASEETIDEILSSMHVPSRPIFVEKILDSAHSMADDKMYDGCKVLRMHVRMCVVISFDVDHVGDDDDDDDDVAEESLIVGASEEAIERLERVEIEEKEELRGPCAICLQEFLIGFKVTRLPKCCHIFHGDCILNWLKKSKACPLCRDEIER